MYKLTREEFFGLVASCAFALALSACDKNGATDNETGIEEINYDEFRATAVYFVNGVAMLIPDDDISVEDGFVRHDSAMFPVSNCPVFFSTKEESSYEQAYNFAITVADEVYIYDEVMSDNAVDISISDRIQSEMGVTK